MTPDSRNYRLNFFNKKVYQIPRKRCVCRLSVSNSFVTLLAAACQAPLSMGFPRQEYWKWVAISSSGVCSWPRDRTLISCIERQILSLVLAGWFFTTSATWEALRNSLKTWMTIFTERRRYLKTALSFAIKILISKKKKHGRSFQTLYFPTRLCAAAQSLRFLSIALYSHGPKDVRE